MINGLITFGLFAVIFIVGYLAGTYGDRREQMKRRRRAGEELRKLRERAFMWDRSRTASKAWPSVDTTDSENARQNPFHPKHREKAAIYTLEDIEWAIRAIKKYERSKKA